MFAANRFFSLLSLPALCNAITRRLRFILPISLRSVPQHASNARRNPTRDATRQFRILGKSFRATHELWCDRTLDQPSRRPRVSTCSNRCRLDAPLSLMCRKPKCRSDIAFSRYGRLCLICTAVCHRIIGRVKRRLVLNVLSMICGRSNDKLRWSTCHVSYVGKT